MFPSRLATRALRTIALTLTLTSAAAAQDVTPPAGNWQLRIPGGALIGTGTQREQLRDAQLTGLQLSRAVTSRLAVTGTFAWARSADIAAVGRPKLDVFTADVGLEGCPTEWFSSPTLSFNTFAGIGGGMRSYNYRALDVDATNNLAAYVSAGGEVGIRRIAVRIEVRDYVTGFKPLVGAGKSEARNDVVLMAAFRFNRRPSESR